MSDTTIDLSVPQFLYNIWKALTMEPGVRKIIQIVGKDQKCWE